MVRYPIATTMASQNRNGKLSLSGSYSRAVSGNTYRLIVSGTIKDSTGTHSISASDTEVCP